MSVTVNGVCVRLGRDPDNGKYVIHVQVYSAQRPGLKADVELDPGDAESNQHLLKLIEVSACAGAEYLGEEYDDNIDPGEAGRNALVAFAEECKLQTLLGRDAPQKVKELENFLSLLSDADRELLLKLRWSLNSNIPLVPMEIEWVNQRLAHVRGNLM